MPIYIKPPFWQRSSAIANAVLPRLMAEPEFFQRCGVDREFTTNSGDLLKIALRFRGILRGLPAKPIIWPGPESFEGRDEEFMQRFCLMLIWLNGRLVARLFWDQTYIAAGLEPGPWEEEVLSWAMDLTPHRTTNALASRLN